MTSRERILERTKQNQPKQNSVEIAYAIESIPFPDPVEKFRQTLSSIGGSVFEVNSIEDINKHILDSYPNVENILTYLPENTETESKTNNGHEYRNIKLAVLRGHFAVAENGAIWITEKNMLDRSLPFISENLVLVIMQNDIVQTMHEAYAKIGNEEYQYGTFIAGPSKTADIEQSLVLGAHGPKTLTVLLQKM